MCAFERLCDKLSSECENEMYALHQLHDMMCADMDDNSDVYGREYRKGLLQNRYGTHYTHLCLFIFSIVDLNPSDEDCIYSTLVYAINQNIRT